MGPEINSSCIVAQKRYALSSFAGFEMQLSEGRIHGGRENSTYMCIVDGTINSMEIIQTARIEGSVSRTLCFCIGRYFIHSRSVQPNPLDRISFQCICNISDWFPKLSFFPKIKLHMKKCFFLYYFNLFWSVKLLYFYLLDIDCNMIWKWYRFKFMFIKIKI